MIIGGDRKSNSMKYLNTRTYALLRIKTIYHECEMEAIFILIGKHYFGII